MNETAVVGVLASVLVTIVTTVIAWVKASFKSYGQRIEHLEAEVKECHDQRLQDAQVIGKLNRRIDSLESRLEKYEQRTTDG